MFDLITPTALANEQDSRELNDSDWSAGPWEQHVRTRLVRQVESSDCGVACLAMVAGVSYDVAREAFIGLGLCDGPAKFRRPFSSNFKELGLALNALGLGWSLQRWRSWDEFEAPCPYTGERNLGILKAKGRSRSQWHWVVAEAHQQLGLVVRDPGSPLVGLRNAPMNVCHRDVDLVVPYGSWIRVSLPGKMPAASVISRADAEQNTPEAVDLRN